MTPTEHHLAAQWADAMRIARALDPDRIAAYVIEAADTGLRATRYDAQGGRTTRVPCDDAEHCHDGPGPHSHIVASDPTGNAATRGRRQDPSMDDLSRLAQATAEMVRNAAVVLDWVCGKRPTTWGDVVAIDDRLMPGTIQAGLDVDHGHQLPVAIGIVGHSVATVEAIATCHMPRTPTQDEQHWTAGLAPEDCCTWHLEIHDRYRRPRVGGTNVCADCLTLAEIIGGKPRRWLMEAMIDHGHRPIAWRASLSRALAELGITQDAG